MTGGVLVACVGNSLLADDAAGYWVFRELSLSMLPKQVRLEHLELGGIALLDHLRGESSLVVVDAVQFGAEVGAIHVIEWEQLPKAPPAVSSHGIGIREAIELGRALGQAKMPERVVLVGIEGDCFGSLGQEPCAVVKRAIHRARDTVLGILEQCEGKGERT